MPKKIVTFLVIFVYFAHLKPELNVSFIQVSMVSRAFEILIDILYSYIDYISIKICMPSTIYDKRIQGKHIYSRNVDAYPEKLKG